MPRYIVTCGFISPPREPHREVHPTLGEYTANKGENAIEMAVQACAREGIELRGTVQAQRVAKA